MKRFFVGMLALLMLAALPVSVAADVIVEPFQDSFYEQHREECVYDNRSYTANGIDAVVIIYQNPESPEVMGKLENGTQLYISFTYTGADGITWGFCELWEQNLRGWVCMDYLVVVYDYISFQEDFGQEFLEESGTLDCAGLEIRLWKYPGSRECYTAAADAEYLPEYQQVYVDQDGRRWGYIGYWMGYRNCWACLDDLTADFDILFPEGVTEPVAAETTLPQTAEPIVPERPAEFYQQAVVAAVCVVAVVLVTAALLVILKKKK